MGGKLYNCTGAKSVGVGGTLPPGKYTLLKPSADRAQAYIPVDIVRKSSVMLEEKKRFILYLAGVFKYIYFKIHDIRGNALQDKRGEGYRNTQFLTPIPIPPLHYGPTRTLLSTSKDPRSNSLGKPQKSSIFNGPAAKA